VIRPLAVLLFSLGLLLGLVLFGATIWADFEAVLFNPGLSYDAPLRSLRCPVMITRSQTGTVTASLANPLDRSTERYVRAHITDGYVTLIREVNKSVPLAPGEKQQLKWSVTADDAAFDRFILIKIVVRGRYPLPSRQGTCGVLVVDVPFLKGGQVFGLSLAVGLLSMVAGYSLWSRACRPLGQREQQVARAMVALTAVVIVGTFVGWMGWWLPGFILFVITLLGIGVIIGYGFKRT
jgi:hypothetical protein